MSHKNTCHSLNMFSQPFIVAMMSPMFRKKAMKLRECMQLVIGRVDEIKYIQVVGGYGGQEWAAKPL